MLNAGSLPMAEGGKPDLTINETAMVKVALHKMFEMVKAPLSEPIANRETLRRFCWIADRIRDLANGNPEPLRRFLDEGRFP